jgi:acetyltransferase
MNPYQPTDPSQNFISRFPRPLDAIFKPNSVALIGAKDALGSVGRTMLLNLFANGFKGRVYPVNPKRDEVLGHKCYPNLAALPETPDLAIIVTPAATVPQIMQECVDRGVKGVIIISAGFKELGPKGLELEQEVLKIAKGKLRIIGPNCLGVMNPLNGMNATFAKGMALPGNIAFISQSGAMCTAVLDWSFQERIGFSSFVSIGSMADVDWGDLIDYLGGEPETRSILIYMETIGDPRSFLTAAREIALEKPIIVIKPGRTQAAAKAAASHTGSLAGSDEVFNAALERVGVLRVDTISELFSMASVLARQPKPKGPNLTIVTNAGGPSVLATDATELHGADLTRLNPETIEALNAFLPAAWSHANPVDLLGDAGADRYSKAIQVLSKDESSDGTLVILSPQDITDPVATAESLRPYAHTAKPILASFMGGSSVSKGIEILNQAGIPNFEYPDDAAETFARMWSYSRNLKSLYETPPARVETNLKNQIEVAKLIDEIRAEGRTLLDEYESKKILSLYDIPTVRTEIAHTEEEAVKWAKEIKFPIVIKLYSKTITHKTDVGGVKLNIKSEDEVRTAFKAIQNAVPKADFEGVTVQPMIKLDGYELILGSSVDVQFGPVLLFGTGGQLVEVFKDRALALPPLNANLARQMMEETKIYEALKGVRGRKPVDIRALEDILVRFSQLIVENRFIKECDINPLLASDTNLIALDARIVLFDKNETPPKLAIRPYPNDYILDLKLKNGEEVTLRPIRPEDEPLVVAFHKELSENSVRQRYFEFVSLSDRIAHERLIRIIFNDYDREMALVAIYKGEVVGIGRLSQLPGLNEVQFTMLIRDDFHNKGLGTTMLKHLINIAKLENRSKIHATILSENNVMIDMVKRLGFTATPEDNLVQAELIL